MSPNGRKKLKAQPKEAIHSGHFMVSEIDDSEVQDGDDGSPLVVHESDCDQETPPIPSLQAFDFESACKETSKTYAFGPRSSLSISIDASLTKLFECMTLAYSGKLTSPRWKQFKGLKLRLKEKIRLNNMIWRAWHMQFIMKLKTFVCQFATPLDGGDMHLKPEAVVIEGTYGKRRSANITAEYKKWRLFFKERVKKKASAMDEVMAVDCDSRWSQRSMDSFNQFSSVDEDFFMDFTDTLFSTFNPSQPFDFPNPKEIAAKAGLADFIQPGLVPLQPSVDDFMDTFEPLQALLNSKLPTLPEEASESPNLGGGASSSPMVPEVVFYEGGSRDNTFGLAASPRTSSSPKPTLSQKKSFLQQKAQQQQQQQQQVPSDKMLLTSLLNLPSNSTLMSQESVQNCPVFQNTLQSPVLSHTDDVAMQSAIRPPDTGDNIFQSFIQSNEPLNNLISQAFPSATSNVLPVENLLQQNLKANNCFSANRSAVLSPQTFALPSKQTLLYQQLQPQQTQQSIQVPFTSFLQQHQSSNNPLNTSATVVKTENSPLFLAVDFGSSSQANKLSSNTFRQVEIPVQISGMPFAKPVKDLSKKDDNSVLNSVRKSSLKSKAVADSQGLRRHSYTTGQHAQSVFMHQTVDTQMNRRSRRIAPATSPPVVSFAVPEIPKSRHRTRSRSVSSPQGGSPKPFAQQSSQAVSLTDINVNLAAHTRSRDEKARIPDVAALVNNASSSVPTVNVLSQNAVLAQLLSSARAECDFGSKTNKTNSTVLNTSSSPVAIIESVPTLMPTTTQQAFVFSPVPLTTVSSVSEFQRNLLVNAANQAFSTQSTQCFVPSPLSNNSANNYFFKGSSTSTSPAGPSTSFETTVAAAKAVRLKSDQERTQYKEHRRVCHINAEQKRRCNIKNGFEALHHLLPPINQNPNAKVSKATLLEKGAEYIRTLKTERQQQQEEAEYLKKQIDGLNEAISHYQSQLPASGVPVPCQKTNRMKEMFEEYVRQQTLKNWKFWIFSLILEPLVESYSNNVSTANIDEMCKSILAWLDQHCSLVALRPGVLNSLRHLSTTTNILTDPSCMQEVATRAVTKKETRPK